MTIDVNQRHGCYDRLIQMFIYVVVVIFFVVVTVVVCRGVVSFGFVGVDFRLISPAGPS